MPWCVLGPWLGLCVPTKEFSNVTAQPKVDWSLHYLSCFGVVLVMDLGLQTWRPSALPPIHLSHWSFDFLPVLRKALVKLLGFPELTIEFTKASNLILPVSVSWLAELTDHCYLHDWKQVSFCHQVFFLQDYKPVGKSFKVLFVCFFSRVYNSLSFLYA